MSVRFAKTAKVAEISGDREERRNPDLRNDILTNREKERELGGELAMRSMARASGNCACNRCEDHVLHTDKKHEKVIKETNGLTIHCANASVYRCDDCPKTVCQLCINEHIDNHLKPCMVGHKKGHRKQEEKKHVCLYSLCCSSLHPNKILRLGKHSQCCDPHFKHKNAIVDTCGYCSKQICNLCLFDHQRINHSRLITDWDKKN